MAGTNEVLERNIRQAIKQAKRRGVVGMSYANLKQVTATIGLTCHPCEYHRQFPVVAEMVAAKMRFNLYH